MADANDANIHGGGFPTPLIHKLNVSKLLQVFGFLTTPRELGACARVCVKWSIVATLDSLWLPALAHHSVDTSFYPPLQAALPQVLPVAEALEPAKPIEKDALDMVLPPARETPKGLEASSWLRTADFSLRLPFEPGESFLIQEGTCKLECLLRHRALTGRTADDAGARVMSPGAHRIFQHINDERVPSTEGIIASKARMYYGGGHELSGASALAINWTKLSNPKAFVSRFRGIALPATIERELEDVQRRSVPPRYQPESAPPPVPAGRGPPGPPPPVPMRISSALVRQTSGFMSPPSPAAVPHIPAKREFSFPREEGVPRVLVMATSESSVSSILHILEATRPSRGLLQQPLQGLRVWRVVFGPESGGSKSPMPTLTSPPSNARSARAQLSMASFNSYRGPMQLLIYQAEWELRPLLSMLVAEELGNVDAIALALDCSALRYTRRDGHNQHDDASDEDMLIDGSDGDVSASLHQFCKLLRDAKYAGDQPLLVLANGQHLFNGDPTKAVRREAKPDGPGTIARSIPTLTPVLVSYLLREALKHIKRNLPDHYAYGNIAWCVQGCGRSTANEPSHHWGVTEGLSWLCAMSMALKLQQDGVLPTPVMYGNLLGIASPTTAEGNTPASRGENCDERLNPDEDFAKLHMRLKPR